MRTAASPSSAASPAPTPTTAATCLRSTFRIWVDAVRAQQFHGKILLITRDPRRRVGTPPAARGGKDHRPSIGPWSGSGHRVDVQDALDWALPSVVGTGDGPPALMLTDLALLG